MLAQSFKSATDLGITEPQKEALMKTLVLLETGKLRHVDLEGLTPSRRFSEKQFSGEFNMSEWSRGHSCGTACCIGGTAELIGGVEFDDSKLGLHGLFYPQGTMLAYSEITPRQAATALRSYLTSGDAKWHEAVS